MAEYKVNIGPFQGDSPGSDYKVNIGPCQSDAAGGIELLSGVVSAISTTTAAIKRVLNLNGCVYGVSSTEGQLHDVIVELLSGVVSAISTTTAAITKWGIFNLNGCIYGVSSTKGVLNALYGFEHDSWLITDTIISATLKNFIWPSYTKKAAKSSLTVGATEYVSNFPVSWFEVTHTGILIPTFRNDFYYKIHIFNKPVNLGPILTTIYYTFYVWNAFFESKTLDEITIDGDLTLVSGPEAPYTFKNLQIESYIAEITKDGPAEFLATVSFDFGADRIIDVIFTGTRAVILFWRPQDDVKEVLEWRTEILKSYDGTEQRIKLRQIPRQHFRLEFVMSTDKMAAWFDSILHGWQKRVWGIPIWTEYAIHVGDINVNDTTINVDTRFADFRNNSLAIIWKSTSEYEIISISTKTDSTLNLSYPIKNAFTGVKYILPFRIAYMTSKNDKKRLNSEASIVEALFSVIDNTNITGYVPPVVYDNFGILASPTFMEDIHNEQSDAQMEVVDFEVGDFKMRSNAEFNLLSQNHIFIQDSKEECWFFRQFLHWMNGKQRAVLVPTFRNDLILKENMGGTDTYFFIENIKLATNMKLNNLRTYVGFIFPDDTLIIRKIIDITEIDDSKERIDINASIGRVAEVDDCKICFVDKCRLASDSVEIDWLFAHRNECRADLVRVE